MFHNRTCNFEIPAASTRSFSKISWNAILRICFFYSWFDIISLTFSFGTSSTNTICWSEFGLSYWHLMIKFTFVGYVWSSQLNLILYWRLSTTIRPNPQSDAVWLKYFQPSTPSLVIFDNHESHLTIKGINLAKENGVNNLTLPPHISIHQAFFGSNHFTILHYKHGFYNTLGYLLVFLISLVVLIMLLKNRWLQLI